MEIKNSSFNPKEIPSWLWSHNPSLQFKHVYAQSSILWFSGWNNCHFLRISFGAFCHPCWVGFIRKVDKT